MNLVEVGETEFTSSLVSGSNGLPSVLLSSSDGCHSCQIYLMGATVSSWRNEQQERLYLSSIAIFDGSKALRGGIPIVFPQFGRPNTSMAQHGFARNSVWSFEGSSQGEACISAHFSLRDSDTSRAVWPHKFTLRYNVTLSATSLRSTLEIENCDTSAFECQSLLHTYICVPDIKETAVSGFKGGSYIDKLVSGPEVDDTSEHVFFTEEVDRVYNFKGTEEPIYVHEIFNHTVEGEVTTVKNELMRVDRWASLEGDRIPVSCVLWNPWIDKAAATADLDDDAYKRFICVEPGTVAGMTRLPAGSKMQLGQCLTASMIPTRVLRQET